MDREFNDKALDKAFSVGDQTILEYLIEALKLIVLGKEDCVSLNEIDETEKNGTEKSKSQCEAMREDYERKVK